jgi:hypothetical protein
MKTPPHLESFTFINDLVGLLEFVGCAKAKAPKDIVVVASSADHSRLWLSQQRTTPVPKGLAGADTPSWHEWCTR